MWGLEKEPAACPSSAMHAGIYLVRVCIQYSNTRQRTSRYDIFQISAGAPRDQSLFGVVVDCYPCPLTATVATIVEQTVASRAIWWGLRFLNEKWGYEYHVAGTKRVQHQQR